MSPAPPLQQTGQYRITAQGDDLVRSLSQAPKREDTTAHPIHGYIGALGGLSTPIADFCRALGPNFDAGPVLGSCQLFFLRPFAIDKTYDVSLNVENLLRKPSRSFGTADHLSLTIKLTKNTDFSALHFTMIVPAEGPRTRQASPTIHDMPILSGTFMQLAPVDGEAMATWCGLLQDTNPIHLHRDAGVAGKRINPGPANLAYLISARMHQHPQRGLGAVTAQFHGNVLEGDRLTATISPDGSKGSLQRDGATLLSATFTE